jgi:hypothetical protein
MGAGSVSTGNYALPIQAPTAQLFKPAEVVWASHTCQKPYFGLRKDTGSLTIGTQVAEPGCFLPPLNMALSQFHIVVICLNIITGCTAQVRFLAGQCFSSLHSVQAGSGAYPVGTGGSFPGDKVALVPRFMRGDASTHGAVST